MKLALKITPNAKKSEVIGWENDPLAGRVLKLRISSPPVEGKANKEIISFLSSLLRIPKSQITFLRGETGKIKLLDLPDHTDLTILG